LKLWEASKDGCAQKRSSIGWYHDLKAEIAEKRLQTTDNQAADTKNVTRDRLKNAILEQTLFKLSPDKTQKLAQ